MSLGLRSLLLTAVILTLSVFAQFSILGHVALPGLSEAERLETEARLERLRSAIDASRHDLASYARDWAIWRETGAYLATLGSDYPFADLVTGTLLAEDIDLFGLYDVKGRLVWGALPETRAGGLPGDPEKLEEYLATPLNLPLEKKLSEGLIDSAAGQASFVAVQPVIHEDFGAGVVGYVLMLRFIDGREVTQWEALSGVQLSVGSPGDNDTEPGANSYDLLDLNGESLLRLELAGAGASFEVARRQFKEAMNYSLIVGAITFFLLVFAFRGFVVEPVARLARQVVLLSNTQRYDSKRRVNVPGRNEAGVIAIEINELLSRLDEKEKTECSDITLSAKNLDVRRDD